jgi:hypothetical protein
MEHRADAAFSHVPKCAGAHVFAPGESTAGFESRALMQRKIVARIVAVAVACGIMRR